MPLIDELIIEGLKLLQEKIIHDLRVKFEQTHTRGDIILDITVSSARLREIQDYIDANEH